MTKYYLYIVNNLKSILLSSSTSKSELRELALQKLGSKSNIKKYDGLYLYRVKITKVSKKEIKNDSMNKIKLIGGPYVATIQRIQIILNNEKSTPVLKNVDSSNQTNKIYFSNKYLSTHNTDAPLEKSIGQMIWDFVQNKFNMGIFAVNTIDK